MSRRHSVSKLLTNIMKHHIVLCLSANLVTILILILALPLANLTLTTTNTTITMIWIPPSFAPSAYGAHHQCHRLCEQTLGPSIPTNLISSPYTFTGIDPGTYCIVSLNGVYGNDEHGLGTRMTTTFSSGKVYYIVRFTNIILFSHYLQHPLHLSVILLSHQLRQGL